MEFRTQSSFTREPKRVAQIRESIQSSAAARSRIGGENDIGSRCRATHRTRYRISRPRCDLFDPQLMTLSHAAAIHFSGSREAAKKRIQKLKAAGHIGERARKSREGWFCFLTWFRAGHPREAGRFHSRSRKCGGDVPRSSREPLLIASVDQRQWFC